MVVVRVLEETLMIKSMKGEELECMVTVFYLGDGTVGGAGKAFTKHLLSIKGMLSE